MVVKSKSWWDITFIVKVFLEQNIYNKMCVFVCGSEKDDVNRDKKKWEKNPIQKKSSTLEKCNIGLVHNLREKSFSFFISDSFQQTHSSHFQLLFLEILMMFMEILFWCDWLLFSVSEGGVILKALKKFNNLWKLWSSKSSL